MIDDEEPAHEEPELMAEFVPLLRARKDLNSADKKYLEELIGAAMRRFTADVVALRAEAGAIRTNLNEIAADQILGKVTKAQLHAATAAGQARLDAIESELNSATVDSPLKPLIGVENIEAAWEALSLSHQRLVIDTLVTVRILPAGQRGRGFDPATLDIRFKEQRKAEAPSRRRRTATKARAGAAVA